MNIYKFELSMLKKSIFVWTVFVPLGLMFYLSFYPLMVGESGSFEVIMQDFPPEFMAFFGMNADLPVFSFLGYFALTYGMIQIPIAIQASNYGFHILSVEERELTADFLMSKPVSRKKILIAKCLAVFTSMTFLNIAVWISSLVMMMIVSDQETIDFSGVNLVLSSTVFLQLVFFGSAMLISVLVKKVSSVLSFSMALAIGMYVVSSLGQMISSRFLITLSPFGHFNPSYIIINGHYEWSLALISFVIIWITIPLGYFFYSKRNIPSL